METIAALDRGWIPVGSLNDDKVSKACIREDSMDFKCILKRGQIDNTIRTAVSFILRQDNLTDTPEGQKILNMSGSDLEEAAEPMITDYFEKHRMDGTTCDFGGIAMLVEQNRTITNVDPLAYQDDEYIEYIRFGPKLWMLIVGGIVIAIIAALAGFVLAMRYSPSFNRKVRSQAVFMPLTKSSNSLLRSSLRLPDLNYEELNDLNDYKNGGGPVSW